MNHSVVQEQAAGCATDQKDINQRVADLEMVGARARLICRLSLRYLLSTSACVRACVRACARACV